MLSITALEILSLVHFASYPPKYNIVFEDMAAYPHYEISIAGLHPSIYLTEAYQYLHFITYKNHRRSSIRPTRGLWVW